jgi:hypothetical protein
LSSQAHLLLLLLLSHWLLAHQLQSYYDMLLPPAQRLVPL